MATEVISIPEGSAGANTVPAWYPAMMNGGNGFFGNGFNSIADLFGLAIIASMFGWGGNGFGGYGGWGGNGAAGFLSNQLNNDNGRELIMQAVTNQGEASRTAIQTLSTMLGQDFNLVNSAVGNVQSALSNLALQQAVSVPQLINSIQSGDASIISAFQKCCCENQLATCQQTNTLQNAISGASQRNVDAIADLKATMVQSFCDVKEREMQSKIDTQSDIITQLRNQISNDHQTLQFNAAFHALDDKIDNIAAKQPNTVPVQWPNIVAANATPYVGGNFNPWGYGYGGTSYWG